MGRVFTAPDGREYRPSMFLTLTLIAGDELTMTQRLSQTALMLGIFLPASYFMDRTLYRASARRKSPPR